MYSKILIAGMQIQSLVFRYLGISPIYWDTSEQKFLYTSRKLTPWKIQLCIGALTCCVCITSLASELFCANKILTLFNIATQIFCALTNIFRVVLDAASLSHGVDFQQCANYFRYLQSEPKQIR